MAELKEKRYKDTIVTPGSDLWELMHSKAPDAKKAAEKMYEQTSANYKKMYSAEDRAWFDVHQQAYFARNKPIATLPKELK
jgi:uncharacterized lipoprotein YehR (DUF1307 family)